MPLRTSQSLSSYDSFSSKNSSLPPRRPRKSNNLSLVRNRNISTTKTDNLQSQTKPTIACFMSAIGESSDHSTLTSRNMSNMMDRDVLRLSSRWSRAVSQNELCDMNNANGKKGSSAPDIYGFDRTLSCECARLEVEAIASMVSLSSTLDTSKKSVKVNDTWDDFETDEIDDDETNLNMFADFMKDDLKEADSLGALDMFADFMKDDLKQADSLGAMNDRLQLGDETFCPLNDLKSNLSIPSFDPRNKVENPRAFLTVG